MSKLIYQVEDKPKVGQLILFALQQLLAIIAGTITVPLVAFGEIAGREFISAAILGCGLGTLVYILITKRKSPVILSSNFAFIGALAIAYKSSGALGLLLGGVFTGLVYVVVALVVKFVGTKWIDKLLPPIVIGPVVALIGLTLASNAMSDLVKANGYLYTNEFGEVLSPYNLIALLCGLVTFIVVVICTVQNRKKRLNLAPFLVGILAGYGLASIFSIFGYCFNIPYLKIVDYSSLINNFKEIKVTSFIDYPRFSLLNSIKEIANDDITLTWVGVAEIALAFIPVSLVSISEHIADHKNLGSIIERDLIGEDPGLHRTLLGDGLGTITGTVLGVCPETTYSQSVGCVAITKNGSTITMIVTSIMCVCLSFFTPLISLLQTIPSCVMGGICLALYGFIAASGINMLKNINISEGKNLFVFSSILIAGVGGLALQIPYQFELIDSSSNFYVASKWLSVSSIAFALVIGVITYLIGTAIEKRNIKENDE